MDQKASKVNLFTGIYLQAITHSSYTKENGGSNNEVLEFFGDAVLQLCVSDLLGDLFPDANEGELSQMRHLLVDNGTLADIGNRLNLGSVLRLGKGELLSGGQYRERNIANAVEALLGATYKDQGLEAARLIVFSQMIEKAKTLRNYTPPKQRLHEWCQKIHHQVPEYVLLEQRGAAHKQLFVMSVLVQEKEISRGQGTSKKRAMISAAESAVKVLGI